MDPVGIFAGVRVIELAQFVFVPGASVLLSDQGAEVIKIETPGHGDPYRTLKVGDGREVGSINLAMEQNNRGKKSVALDLKSPEGREALLRLVETADVFITSLRPRAIRALGLDVQDLRARNRRLIYARGNGLGFAGAEADKPGFDASAFWARGGLAYALTLPGNQTTPPRPALGDHSAATSLAFAIAGALFRRERTGEGGVVETSLLQTAVWILSSDVTYSQVPSYKVHSDFKVRFPLMAAYPTRDGRLIQLMLLDPRPHWPSLCRMLGLDALIEDARFVDNAARLRNADALAVILAETLAARDWADWQPAFDAWDAPWELIRTIADLHEDPQVLVNGMIYAQEIDGTPIRLVSGPATFDGEARPVNRRGSPGMGEHTQALLREIGYGEDEIGALRERGLVQ